MQNNKTYWKEFLVFRTELNYLGYYKQILQNRVLRLNLFVAFATSGSVGAWVVWDGIPQVWAGIIAGSAIINTIRPHLRYEKRMESLSGLYVDISNLCLEFEKNWYYITKGEWSDEEIHLNRIDLIKRRDSSLAAWLPADKLPQLPKFLKKAEEDAAKYLAKYAEEL